LGCELCKATYPTYIHAAGGEREPLVEVPPTRPPFVVLENLARDLQQHASRGLHVISLAGEKALKLGRGHESDVRIADVSISRCHAVIRCQGGQFLLEDNHSKFGTLVAMKKPRRLEPGNPLSIQMGRTLLSLSLSDFDATAAGSSPPTAQRQGNSINSAPQEERGFWFSHFGGGRSSRTEGSSPNNQQDPWEQVPREL
jgi:predicted component of type VI protein secretion system